MSYDNDDKVLYFIPIILSCYIRNYPCSQPKLLNPTLYKAKTPLLLSNTLLSSLPRANPDEHYNDSKKAEESKLKTVVLLWNRNGLRNRIIL